MPKRFSRQFVTASQYYPLRRLPLPRDSTLIWQFKIELRAYVIHNYQFTIMLRGVEIF